MRDFIRFLNAALAGLILALLLALSLFPVRAHADIVPTVNSYSCSYPGFDPLTGSSREAACIALGQYLWAGTGYTNYRAVDCDASTCVVQADQPSGGYTQFLAYWVAGDLSCPANSSLSGLSCSCDPGFTDSGGVCISSGSVVTAVSLQPFDLSLESAAAIGGAVLMLLSVAFVIRILRKALESSESE